MLDYLRNITDLTPYLNTPPFCAVRVNPLKLTKAEFEKNAPFEISDCEFYEYGYRIKSEDKTGLHPLHLAGGYYVQEPSAMSAITALDPQKDDIILDACAAPGSKATAIAPLCKVLVANEYNRARAMTLVSNIERMGIANALVTNGETDKLASAFEGYFDKVLVDSPCSGEGMFRKHPSILEEWSEDLVKLCAQRSYTVLENCAKTLKAGGRLVYSTCTYNLEENEKLIISFLENHPEFEIADTGLGFGEKGLIGLDKARRIFIKNGGEGHFVCALTKLKEENRSYLKPWKLKYKFDFLEGIVNGTPQFLSDGDYGIMEFSGIKYALHSELPDPKGVHILRAGVKLGEMNKNVFRPDHHLALSLKTESFCTTVPTDLETAFRYLHGEEIEGAGKGFCGVTYNGLCMGFGKVSNGRVKNHLPKGLRITSL